MIVAVLGASGFVGSAVVQALLDQGEKVHAVRAPRLTVPGDADSWAAVRPHLTSAVDTVRRQLVGVDVVVNAAGIADARSSGGDVLLGANAALPGVLAEACVDAGVRRVVHISSAAVHGRDQVLDESSAPRPFSPYSVSKAVGEQWAREARAASELVILRPTSVHGPGRRVTRSLARFARSSLSSVAGAGERDSPQVRVENVAAAVVFLVEAADIPPAPVLQPGEGMTTGSVLRLLGLGREPRHLPPALARRMVGAMYLGQRVRPSLAAHARRLEMLWWGQEQRSGWLDDAGFVPVVDESAWLALGRVCAAGSAT